MNLLIIFKNRCILFLFSACENLMVSELSLDTVGSLWTWASEAGGSAYVRRQCITFVLTEFSRICASHLLLELEEDLLYECLLSDYVQVLFIFFVFCLFCSSKIA